MSLRWLPAMVAGFALLAAQPLYAVDETETSVVAEAAQADAAPPLTEEEKQYIAWAQTFVSSLNYQKGEIQLPGGVAKLIVPDDFYYLSPEDAERVLTEA